LLRRAGIGAHTQSMTDARWIEHVRCPNCGKTGQAELVEVSQFNNRFEIVPIGFKVITEQYGSNLYCETCNVPVVP
jgi:hypothetical protein